MSIMAKKLLVASNLETFSINATSKGSKIILGQIDSFVSSLPQGSRSPQAQGSSNTEKDSSGSRNLNKDTYITAPFPIHFCSAALPG
jgi:hypothetical protein